VTTIKTCIVGLAILLGVCRSATAQPFVESVNPPVLQRGKTNRIELVGRNLTHAIDLWSSVPSVQLTSKLVGSNTDERATFDVVVPSTSPLGIFGLRVASLSGLGNVHLFLIDELPIVRRSREPNLINSRQRVDLPVCVWAECRKEAIDRYEINVQSGQRVAFEVVGNRLGKDYDPLVLIRDHTGRLLAEHDTDVGLYFDCRFSYRFPAAGSYTVEVRDARYEGHPTWNYVLRMGDFPAARVAVPSSVTPGKSNTLALPELGNSKAVFEVAAGQPTGWLFREVRLNDYQQSTWVALHTDRSANAVEVEPNNDREHATVVSVPATLHGVLQSPSDVDWFRFSLEAGQTIHVESEARGLGSPADLELVLVDKTGREHRRIDDATIKRRRQTIRVDSRFSFSTRTDGEFDLQVRDMAHGGGPAFSYRVQVEPNEPKLELEAEIARATIPQGNYQPVPIIVTRNRLAGVVKLSLLGAPAGVTLSPSEIPADRTEIVCQLRAAKNTPLGLSTLQIVGTWTSEDAKNKTSATAITQPLIDKRVRNKDLQVFALRQDQLRLPPSLTNRLALMITPPSPVDVKLSSDTLLLTKYQEALLPIATTRVTGFDAPIKFTAVGGQIGPESEERSNVFIRFPLATAATPNVNATFYNRILTSYLKQRINLSATTQYQGHEVTLNRTFDLDVKAAFSPTIEPAKIEIEPGQSTTIRFVANRTPTYDGAITMTLPVFPGFNFPKTIEIPSGKTHVDLKVTVDAEITPKGYQLRLVSKGYVGRYEEEIRGPNISISVKKPAKKK
jgi:hypothetical protein